MAMDKDTLASLMKSKLSAVLPGGSSTPDEDYLKALADAIISHIQDNAEVSTTVNGQTSSGSPGGPLPIVDQPGSGTIS
jgi:hypothetical protein